MRASMHRAACCGMAALSLGFLSGKALGASLASDGRPQGFHPFVSMGVHGGNISNADIAAWLRLNYPNLIVTDLDGNGLVNNEDAAVAIANVLSGLLGDFDRSGKVDVADMVRVLKGFSNEAITPSDGDVNADGIVDASDLMLTSSALGRTVEIDTLGLARQMIDEALAGEDQVIVTDTAAQHAPYFSNTYTPPQFPNGPDDDFPPNHEGSISGTWPGWPSINPPPPGQPYPGDRHWVGVSQFPPNHYNSISQGWGTPFHTVESSSKEWPNWPPNHDRPASMTWNQPGPGGLPHAVATSRTWNPGHRADISRNFEPHPNPKLPMLPMPSPHLTQTSTTWGHQQSLSAIAWPPGHMGPISGSWPRTHTMNTSILWPGSHWQGPSATWPGDTDTGWPPNHFYETSKTWGDPPDPIRWFPPDHSIWTTASEIIPLIPTPTKPPSGAEILLPAPGGAGGGAVH